MEENHSFEYTYSAPEQDEVRRIREKYLPKSESKLERLRKLDASAARKATIASIILGIIGTLVMGSGMSMTTVWGEFLFIPGVIVGSIGIVGIGLAYPLYSRILEKEKAKIAPEILRLTEELMGDNK